jgi:hypothetical protein
MVSKARSPGFRVLIAVACVVLGSLIVVAAWLIGDEFWVGLLVNIGAAILLVPVIVWATRRLEPATAPAAAPRDLLREIDETLQRRAQRESDALTMLREDVDIATRVVRELDHASRRSSGAMATRPSSATPKSWRN